MTWKPDLCIYHGNISLADAAYLAGLIDGEGHIAVSRTRTWPSAKACKRGFAYRSSIIVSMTDKEVLDWAHGLTGLGNIRYYGANATSPHGPASPHGAAL